MSKQKSKPNWIWQAYFYFILPVYVFEAINFISIKSPMHLYYAILYSFDVSFAFDYFSSAMRILLNLLHLIPFYFFLKGERCGNQKAQSAPKFFNGETLKNFLIFRIIFEITGHSYELNFLISVLRLKPLLFYSIFLSSLAILLPSYIGCYIYASRKNLAF